MPTPAAAPTLAADDVKQAKALADRIRARFSQTLIGQEHLRESLILTMVAGGHILIESVPGLAKTTAAQTLATSVSGTFKRIQCTPDLMPSDIVGTQVFDFATQKFTTQVGPIHANFVLLDEINRSNAKTQSAMLEAMAEGASTIGGERIALPKPFMVIATQNPIEEEGTFALPEAQMDRFMMKAIMNYPTADEEKRMLALITRRGSDMLDPLQLQGDRLSIRDVGFLRAAAKRVYVSDAIMQYAVDHLIGGHAVGQRFERQHQAVAQHVGHHGLHILRNHIFAALEQRVRLADTHQCDRRSRRSAQTHQGTQALHRVRACAA